MADQRDRTQQCDLRMPIMNYNYYSHEGDTDTCCKYSFTACVYAVDPN